MSLSSIISRVVALERGLADVLRTLGRLPVRTAAGGGRPSAYIAQTGAGGIPARSGTTPGSATVTVWRIAGTTLTATTQTLTAHNLSVLSVAASVYIQIKRDAYGKWLVDWEDC